MLLLGAVAGPPACATTRYWDSNTAAAGLGGAGTWSTGSAFWGLAADGVSGPYASWSNAALDDADLRGTGGTLTLSGALTAHNLAFNSSGYILNGSTLTLGGVTPTITTSADARINSVLAGNVGLTKDGSGTLILGGANTYTGSTIINAGVLQLTGASNRLPTATDLTIANVAGATLDLNSLNQQLASLAGGGASGGAVSLGSGTLTLSKASGSTNFAGVISGSGGLTKAGASTQILSGANSYSGATTVSAGVLNIQNGSALGSTAGGTSVTSGAALALQGGISVGAEALTLNGTGISSGGALRSVSGNNSYAGALTLGSNSRINSDDGLLSLSGGISGATRTLTMGGAGSSLISGAIATTTGGLIKNGAGTLTLSGANSYTGATTLSAGVLNIQHGSALGGTAGGTSVASGAALELQGGISVGAEALTLNGTGIGSGGALRSISGNNSYAGALTLGSNSRINSDAGLLSLSGGITGAARTLTVGGAGNTSLNGAIATTTGGLIKDGSGTLTLAGASTYTGATTLNGGILRLSGGSNRLSTATALSIANVAGATLDLNSLNQQLASLAGGGASGGAVSLGSGTLTLNKASGSTSFAGVISGSGGVTKAGASTQILTGANTYTGATTVSAGVLNIQNGSALGSTAGGTSVTSGAALALQGSIDIGAEALTLNGTGIGSGGALRSVSGNNSYVGALTLGSNSRINTDAGLLTLNGGITGATRTLTVGGAGNTLISGAIATTTGGLIKDGAGTLTLAGTSTYTGATTLNGGILRLSGAGNRLSTATALTIASLADATFDLNGFNQQLASLAGGGASGGAVSLGSGTLTLNKASGSTTFAGVISGSGGLTKAGASTQILSGANSYSGATMISAGVLNIQNGSALGSTVDGTSVTSGAALALQGGIDVGAEALTLNGTGISSGGALRSVSGNNSYAGALTLGSNSRINADAGLLTLSGGVTGATRTLTVGGAGSSLISGAIATTTGGLTKDGAGSLTLSGANSYSGTTTVSAGVLNIQHGSALGTTAGGTSVSSGAALELQGGISVGAEALTLNGTGIGSGGALRSVSGNNSYAGALTLGSNSRINADAGLLTLSGGITGATRTLTVGGAGNTLIGGAIATTSGGLAKDGAGTLTLTGTNSYSGATTVSAGVLNIQNGSALGTTAGGTSVSSGAALELQGGIGVGAEALTLNGAGIGNGGALRNIAGNNSYAGALTLGSDSRISSDSGLLTLSSAISGAGMNLAVGGAGHTLIGGAIALGSGGLSKDGSGTLTLGGASNYTGPTRIEGGLLVINAAGSLSGMQNTVVGSGATLQVDGSFTGSAGADSLDVSGNISGSGAIDLAGGDDSLLLDDGADLTELASALDAGAGNDSLLADITGSARLGAVTGFETLDKQGSGLLGIYASSPLLFEQVLVNAGTLLVASGSSLDAQSLRVASGATLQVDGSVSGVLELSGSLVGTGGVSLGAGDDVLTLHDGADLTGLGLGLDGGAGNDTLLLDSAAGLSVSGTQLSGFELLTKQGGGIASLSGSSSFNFLQVDAGTLALVAGGSLSGVQDAQITSGATLQIDGAYSGSSGVDSLEVSGNLTGSGTLDLGAGADSLILRDGADLSGLESTINGGADSDSLLLDNAAGLSFSGTQLSGFELLTKQGGGIASLSGSSSFNFLQVDAGTLALVAGGSLAGVQDAQIASGATLQVDGAYSGSSGADSLEISGNLTGSGTLDLGAGADSLTLHDGADLSGLTSPIDGGADSDVLLADLSTTARLGTLQGFETLTKQGLGTLGLYGAQASQVEQLQVEAGTLLVASGATLQVLATQVASGATLQVEGDYSGSAADDRLELSGSLVGAGSVDLGEGNDSLVLHAGASLDGLAAGVSAGSGNDVVLFDNAQALAVAGAKLQGFEQLIKQNAGLASLSANATFNSVQVAGGTLLVEAGAGVAEVQRTQVGTGALLQVDGSYAGSSGADSLEVSGSLSGTGSVTLGAGDDRLILQDGADLTGLAVALDGGAGNDTLLATVDGSARLGSAIGFETLRKQGVGTLGIYGAQTSVFDRVQVDAGTLLVAAGVTVDPQTTVIGAGATLQVDGTYLGTTGDDTFDVFGVLRGSGTVDLLDGADLLTLHSAADLTGFTTALDGGAGVDTVRLDAFSGSLPGLLDWERVELLNNSVLSQDSELDLGGGVLAIAAGSSWQPGVFGLNGSVDNGGVIGAAGKRVAISGNYRSLGDSGQLDVLVSPSTLSAGGLVIAGDVQGRTLVNFASDDSLQTEAGDILVIASPNDDLATAGSFVPSTLDNGLVRLNGSLEPWVFGQQADHNWYLSPLSSQRLPETAGYTGTATLGRLLAEQLAQGADERFAEARSCQSELRSGRSSQDCGRSWLQTGNQDAMLSDAGARLEGDIGSAYFGYDQLHQGPADGADLLLGAYFGYQDADFHSTTAAGRAQLDMSAPALALYGSLYWADQSYVDLSLTGAWLQSRVTTADGFSEALHGRSLGANARFGRQFAMANDWFLEPQLGASLAQQDWQEQTDASGKRIDIDAGLRSSVDASLRLGTRFAGSSGLVLQPWAKVGASYVLSGEGSDVQLEAGGKQQRLSGLEQGSALAFSAGALLQLNPQVGLFSALSHTAELSGADYRGTEIRAGVRASW
ncbi:MAG: autotransporter-associated beta strand repeat-containing protein [Pseudomonas sp.]